MNSANQWKSAILCMLLLSGVGCAGKLEGVPQGDAQAGEAGSGGEGATNGGASAAGGKRSTATAKTSATGGRTAATGGTTSTGGATSTGGISSITFSSCPGTGGPAMVLLPEGYWIDSTEVTRGQYAAWRATITRAIINGQDAANCSWNETFIPDASCMRDRDACQGTNCENHPQVCVDWCDAFAYCKGVGKRLCGKIGGGANAHADYAKASASQWYNACVSGSAANTYPYGKTYNATACNGANYGTALGTHATVAVGSLPSCQASAPYAGVYDLSGNVNEWEDSCDADGQWANCRLRGGYFSYVGDFLVCGLDDSSPRGYANYAIGFRCCAP